jgi:hypothetical protein
MNRKELVEQMLKAALEKETHIGDPWDREVLKQMIGAALDKAEDVLLRKLTGDERIKLDQSWDSNKQIEKWPRDRAASAFNAVVDFRRLLLTPEKSIEERVTAEFVSASAEFGHTVFVDGVERGLFTTSLDAAMFRRSLIQDFKEAA